MAERFSWDPSLATGHSIIDQQHMNLFELARAAQNAVDGLTCGDDPVGDAIFELSQYCVEHFGDEEELMAEAGFPELGVHREMHRALSEKTLQMMNRYFGGEEMEAAQVAPFVIDWLTRHIADADRTFVEYLEERR